MKTIQIHVFFSTFVLLPIQFFYCNVSFQTIFHLSVFAKIVYILFCLFTVLTLYPLFYILDSVIIYLAPFQMSLKKRILLIFKCLLLTLTFTVKLTTEEEKKQNYDEHNVFTFPIVIFPFSKSNFQYHERNNFNFLVNQIVMMTVEFA
jgi:hypothetical protein